MENEELWNLFCSKLKEQVKLLLSHDITKEQLCNELKDELKYLFDK